MTLEKTPASTEFVKSLEKMDFQYIFPIPIYFPYITHHLLHGTRLSKVYVFFSQYLGLP